MNNKVPNLHVPDETSSNSGSNARSQVAQPVKDSAQERPRKRRVQRRAEETKEKIRQAATQLFSDLGYSGSRIRDIENAAGVKRGIVNHHFGSKEKLWIEIVDYMFGLVREHIDTRAEMLKDLSLSERGPYLIRSYVRFSAAHPELARLMLQESKHCSPRLSYIIDNHSRPIMRQFSGNFPGLTADDSQHPADFMFWYYSFLGASSLVYAMAPEAQALFGFDRHDQTMIDRHANFVADFFLDRSKNE